MTCSLWKIISIQSKSVNKLMSLWFLFSDLETDFNCIVSIESTHSHFPFYINLFWNAQIVEIVWTITYTISALPCACYRFTALIYLCQVLFVFLNCQPCLNMGFFAFSFYFVAFYKPDQSSSVSFSCHSALRKQGSTLIFEILVCLPYFTGLDYFGWVIMTCCIISEVVFLHPCRWFYLI